MTESLKGARILHVALAIGLAGEALGQDRGLEKWAVPDGYSLEIAARGFSLPTTIAFVPRPGPDPSSILYFVGELGGAIKSVARDGQVRVFTKVDVGKGPENGGVGAICLDAKRGYVFVSHAWLDPATDVRENRLVRVSARPDTFDSPGETLDLSGLLRGFRSGANHQIGGCQVVGDALYVGVGDGANFVQSRRLDNPQGKVLKLTLEGKPYPDNPFFSDDAQAAAAFAYGFRNPFGIKWVGDSLYAADNGIGIDRLVRVLKGEDYLWNGTDTSIAARGDVVFSPGVCPAGMDYAGDGRADLGGELSSSFLIASAGVDRDRMAGIVSVPFDRAKNRYQVPRWVVRYVGDGTQAVVAVAVSPGDGVYFAPMIPGEDGTSPILRLRFQPEKAHAIMVEDSLTPRELMQAKLCAYCHKEVYGDKLTRGVPTIQPQFLVPRLQKKLSDPAYLASLAAMDKTAPEGDPGRAARAAVRAKTGDARVQEWITQRLLNPSFDHPLAQMPSLGLTENQAKKVAQYLMVRPGKTLLSQLPPARYSFVAAAFGAGALIAAFSAWLKRWFRRRHKA